MTNLESEFVRHAPCEECGSSDAKAIYSDGHTYCFSCQTRTSPDGQHTHKMTTNAQLKGYADQLPKRGISERVCEKYKVYRDGNTLRFHYYSRDGLLLGAKVKTLDKQFSYEGETDGSFFGQHLFPSKGKRVVITEGELYALSLHECFPTWPHVSLPTGAAGAKKACQRNLEWLQGYDEIVLWFVDDEPGRQAVKAAASVLPPNKVKIAKAIGDYKDASDALQANDFNAIERAVYDAKPYRPDGIVDGQSIYELVTTPNPPSNHEYPVEGLNKLLHGIRYGELVTITAGSGIGKSSFCRELATSL